MAHNLKSWFPSGKTYIAESLITLLVTIIVNYHSLAHTEVPRSASCCQYVLVSTILQHSIPTTVTRSSRKLGICLNIGYDHHPLSPNIPCFLSTVEHITSLFFEYLMSSTGRRGSASGGRSSGPVVQVVPQRHAP